MSIVTSKDLPFGGLVETPPTPARDAFTELRHVMEQDDPVTRRYLFGQWMDEWVEQVTAIVTTPDELLLVAERKEAEWYMARKFEDAMKKLGRAVAGISARVDLVGPSAVVAGRTDHIYMRTILREPKSSTPANEVKLAGAGDGNQTGEA